MHFRIPALVVIAKILIFFSLSFAYASPTLREVLLKTTGQTQFRHLILSEQYGLDLKEVLETPELGPNEKDSEGATPLHYACYVQNFELVEKILKLGGNPNVADHRGITPLMLASLPFRGREDNAVRIITLLKAFGADIFAQDNQGETALIKSTIAGKLPIVQHLRTLGAHILDSKNFKNAAQVAQYFQRTDVFNYFITTMPDLPALLSPSRLGNNLETINKEIIHKHAFTIDRSLSHYLELLGPGFRSFLENLTENDHILDAGSGETCAFTAYASRQLHPVLEWETQSHFPDGPRATATAVTLTISRRSAIAAKKAGVRLFNEKLFEEIRDSELIRQYGLFTGIIDYYGIFAYSDHPDQVLRRYLKLLRRGGKIFVMMGEHSSDIFINPETQDWGYAGNMSSLYESTVFQRSGNKIKLPNWLRSIPGIKITSYLNKYPREIGKTHQFPFFETFEIEMMDSAPVRIPALRMLDLKKHTRPPHERIYEETGQELRLTD